MNKEPGIQKRNILLGFLFFIGTLAMAQQKLPKDIINQPQKILTPNKQVIKKDSVKYAVKPTVTLNTHFATADQLYLSQGSFLVRTVRDYRYLTAKDDYSRSSIVFRYEPWFSDTQLWNFILQADGSYKIKNGQGLFLEMGGNSTYYVVSKAEANTDKQIWQLEVADNGNYYIKAKSGQYLSVTTSQVIDGSVAGLRDTRENNNFQKWHLIKWTNDNRKLTTFDPVQHGFHFVNTFSGEDALKWGGLCGGMVYTVLDYFRNSMPIPTQSYTPANRTTLQSYIYERQNHSIWNVNEKWSELEVSYNTRGGEIFRWGMQGTGGGRLEQLKNSIDAGVSRPIGLFAGGVHGLDGSDGSRHVVLAMGYTVGRYTGNLSGYVGDYKIFAWDPNMRNQMVTIVPDMVNQCYFEVQSGKAWRTYFVNDRYDNDHVPPAGIPNFPEGEPEGSIRNLYAEFQTGGDDLRGGSDNVSITIRYHDGTQQAFLNVNNGARWVDGTTNTVHLALNRAVSKADIDNFMITTSFGSGDGSDDWNLNGFKVTSGWNGILFGESWAEAGNYIFRFSGDQGRQRHIVLVR